MGKSKQGGLGALLGIGLGVAAGWGLRKLLQEKYDKSTGVFRQPVSEKELIKTVFGEYSQEAADYYNQVRQEIISQFTQLQTSLSEIDTAKYKELVNEALEKIQRDKSISKDQIDDLRDYLMDDFAQIKSKAKSKTTKESVKTKVVKASKKVAQAKKDLEE